MRAVAIALVLAGCGQSSGLDDGSLPDGGPSDSPGIDSCGIGLSFNPDTPIAGPLTTIRVSAHVVHAPGVLTYLWRVRLNGTTIAFTPAQSDSSEIDFPASSAGSYQVHLEVDGAACPTVDQSIEVRPPGALRARLRLRVVSPGGVAPPLEQRREVDGGTNANFGIISIDSGSAVTAIVRGPGGAVPAYLRFAPSAMPDAVVEAFADTAGMVTTRLLAQPHSVLVIPSVASVAPSRIPGWSSTAALDPIDIAAGSTITGTVRDPDNAPLAGATVKLSIAGVPSTVATTASDGSFTLRAVAGTAVAVEVTPPSTSGLPRLSATSQTFDLGAGLQIRYAASLVRRDLAGTVVKRAGAPVAGAKLMVVGSLAAVGTVTAGTSATASGEVRIAASASAAGTLPATLVPAAALSAVVTVAPGDLAVAALDSTDGVPASIDALAMLPVSSVIRGPGTAILPGAVLDVIPTGALAMAAAPAQQVTAGTDGRVTIALASGGHYDLRFRDPAGRAALLVVTDRVTATIATEYHLRNAISIKGTLMLRGTQPLANAAVQILCDECNGLERVRPIAEAVSDAAGVFTLVVPDPGTN